jgi:hypothetical protein
MRVPPDASSQHPDVLYGEGGAQVRLSRLVVVASYRGKGVAVWFRDAGSDEEKGDCH